MWFEHEGTCVVSYIARSQVSHYIRLKSNGCDGHTIRNGEYHSHKSSIRQHGVRLPGETNVLTRTFAQSGGNPR